VLELTWCWCGGQGSLFGLGLGSWLGTDGLRTLPGRRQTVQQRRVEPRQDPLGGSDEDREDMVREDRGLRERGCVRRGSGWLGARHRAIQA